MEYCSGIGECAYQYTIIDVLQPLRERAWLRDDQNHQQRGRRICSKGLVYLLWLIIESCGAIPDDSADHRL
jgi:hypothetical protein